MAPSRSLRWRSTRQLMGVDLTKACAGVRASTAAFDQFGRVGLFQACPMPSPCDSRRVRGLREGLMQAATTPREQANNGPTSVLNAGHFAAAQCLVVAALADAN